MIGLRMSLDVIAVVDKWADKNGCTRSESIRQLVEAGLKAKPAKR